MRLFGGYGSDSLSSLAAIAARPVALPSNVRANSATGTNWYARVSSAQYCCADREHILQQSPLGRVSGKQDPKTLLVRGQGQSASGEKETIKNAPLLAA